LFATGLQHNAGTGKKRATASRCTLQVYGVVMALTGKKVIVSIWSLQDYGIVLGLKELRLQIVCYRTMP